MYHIIEEDLTKHEFWKYIFTILEHCASASLYFEHKCQNHITLTVGLTALLTAIPPGNYLHLKKHPVHIKIMKV